MSDLANDGILRWLDYEISGYPEGVAIPSYRKTHGILMGSYFRGSMATHMTWNHVSIPLGKMPDDIKELLLSVEFHESVEALRKLAQTSQDSGNQLGKTIPADLFSAIATYNDDPYMIITSARVVVGEHIISNIFSVIENKLLDMLTGQRKSEQPFTANSFFFGHLFDFRGNGCPFDFVPISNRNAVVVIYQNKNSIVDCLDFFFGFGGNINIQFV